ncbi:MAG: shikimate dehydrogenase family protein [Bacteroidales bacterium]
MELYGLVGYSLTHSFSKAFFNKYFENNKIDARYVNYEIESINELMPIIKENKNLVGINITIPYKEEVLPLLDKIDDNARTIGAVNVIKIVRTGSKIKLEGYNSDILGFVESIKPLIKPRHKKALILGTGGAGKAIGKGLDSLAINSTIVSRFQGENLITYNDLNRDVILEHKVIVNCTPLGTYPDMDTCPPIPYGFLGKEHILYDLVYNPPKTKFLKYGELQGSTIENGAKMLELQALEAFRIWNS